MKAVMVMYDTLCRDFLAPYGNSWVETPNFSRLAEKSVTFDENYVCSLPCMPARRDLHNSRVNFLQRSWGPLEPFDDSMPEILKKNGIFTALFTDHCHYAEDGGATYHPRYNVWSLNRGQEGDPCVGDRNVVEDFVAGTNKRPWYMVSREQDTANRRHASREELMPQAKTFQDGLDFIEQNHDLDHWFLQIETFDPHEPFFTQPDWKEHYPELAAYTGSENDWPSYEPVKDHETPEDVTYVRTLYAALVTMCDHYLGTVLDLFDQYNLWEDTMLIVNTDHGFLLGEHDWWGKTIMPAYEEVSHTPLFIYDPVSRIQGERREQLTCPLDLPVTLLDFFGVDVPRDMQGHSLLPVIREGKSVRDMVLFGYHASQVALTDGRYTYFRAPLVGKENLCYDYTLMPTRMRKRFGVEELQQAEFAGPLPNTKGCKVLKVPAEIMFVSPVNFGTHLFDVKADPRQEHPIDDPELEAKLASLMVTEMKKADAPAEQYERLGLPEDGHVTAQMILETREQEEKDQTPDVFGNVRWTQEAKNAWRAWVKMMPEGAVAGMRQAIADQRKAEAREDADVSLKDITDALKATVPVEQQQELLYLMLTVSRAF